jgi:15-cis-phytoene synthase
VSTLASGKAQGPRQLAAAYSVCRGITRTAARNFYYAFLVLPREKRDALSAVYAFMRHSDDISDDPAVASADKSERLTTWRADLHRVIDGAATDDPILFALADAQRRFDIRVELLDQLVAGTEMDIADPGLVQDSPRILYRNFDELKSYCYHVASVVGLICIRVFGYRDSAAEPLAERCGVAFQLTNIIRDVKEDALMGRIYLPQDDLVRFQRSAEDFTAAKLNNGFEAERLRPVLELEAHRAREFYRAADDLVPLVDEDCRAALWVLVEIYRRLLEKIAARGYDVFREKVRLSTAEKLAVMSKGFWRRLTA